MPRKNKQNPFQKIAVYALSEQGACLAYKLSFGLKAELFLPNRTANLYTATRSFDSLQQIVQENFNYFAGHVFIAASGLVIRIISPLLAGKEKDPGIVVLDQHGEFAISLLSGHLGNANELAKKTARITGGTAVITTATDNMGLQAIDTLAVEKDMAICNIQAIKSVNMALLENQEIQVVDPEHRLGLDSADTFCFLSSIDELEKDSPAIIVDWRDIQATDLHNHLLLRPRVLVAGIGCNSGTFAQEILKHLEKTFSAFGLSLKSLKHLSSITKKQDEPGLLEAAKQLGICINFVPCAEIENIQVPNPSTKVQKNMGVSSICEATALYRTGGGRLIVPKTKSSNTTLAVALQS